MRIEDLKELQGLIFMTGSSLGLSLNQKDRLNELYNNLTNKEKNHIDIWSKRNNRELDQSIQELVNKNFHKLLA